MKTFLKSNRLSKICASLVLIFAASTVVNAQEAEVPCPFNDDEVILYFSPSILAQTTAVQKVVGSEDFQNTLKKAFDKADAAFESEKDKDATKKVGVEYLASLMRDAASEKSVSRAAFNCYFRFIAGVVLAADLPENGKDPADYLAGLSLTYVLNFDPCSLEVSKFMEEGKDFEVVKYDSKETIGKIFVREGDELKTTVFFGVTKIKDFDKYAFVLAGTKEGVEKKISRFQGTNVFFAKRADEGAYAEYIFKPGFFNDAAKKLAEKGDDQAKAISGIVGKVDTLRMKSKGIENGINLTITLNAKDAETARTISDLANGGLAVVRLKAGDAEKLPAEAKMVVDLLTKTEVVLKDNETALEYSLDVPTNVLQTLTKAACGKINVELNK